MLSQEVISPEVKESIDKIPTPNVAAYDLYVRANHERFLYNWSRDVKHLQTAHDLFDKALKIDPEYLLAIVGKGQTFNNEFKMDSAFVYADRAIALDPEFKRSYGLKGYAYLQTGKNDLARELFFKAISLPPKDDFWYHYHTAIGSQYIRRQNDVIRALPYLRKGIEKEESQYISGGYSRLAGAYTFMGDYERAEVYFSKILESELCFGIYQNSHLMMVQGTIKTVI
jgi:tetratricopeptide (TPR) repeat protein